MCSCQPLPRFARAAGRVVAQLYRLILAPRDVFSTVDRDIITTSGHEIVTTVATTVAYALSAAHVSSQCVALTFRQQKRRNVQRHWAVRQNDLLQGRKVGNSQMSFQF